MLTGASLPIEKGALVIIPKVFKAEMALKGVMLGDFIGLYAEGAHRKYKMPKRPCHSAVSSMWTADWS